MALKIAKGQGLKIQKADGSALNRVRLDLFWNEDGPKKPYDLDGTVLAVDITNGLPGQHVGEQYVCFYHQQVTQYAKHLKGDNRNGQGSGADEQILIDLAQVPTNANFLPLLVTIDSARQRGQDFSQVSGARAELVNDESGEVLATIELERMDAGTLGVLFAGIQREGNGWKIQNISQGYPKEFGEFLNLFGIATE